MKVSLCIELVSCINYNRAMIVNGERFYMVETKRGPGRPKTDTPNKDKRVSFRMEPSEYERLKDFSKERGLTVADTINRGIELVYQSACK